MGYRVENQCFPTKEMADDYVLSSVRPTLDADGNFSRPEKVQGGWLYKGESYSLSYPECSFKEQFLSGFTVGISFLLLFVVMWGFKQVRNFITMRNNGGSYDS